MGLVSLLHSKVILCLLIKINQEMITMNKSIIHNLVRLATIVFAIVLVVAITFLGLIRIDYVTNKTIKGEKHITLNKVFKK